MAEEPQLTFVCFSKGSYIAVEGKRNAECFFIIREGQVELSKEVEIVAEERGNNLGPGDFFGVVSAMSGHSHIETARARTDVTLISVRREQYGQLIRNNAPVAMKIIRHFSRRVRYLDQALTRLTLHSSATVDKSHLYKVAEYYGRQNRYSQAFYACHRYVKYCPKAENIDTAKALLLKLAPYAKAVRLDYTANDTERVYPKDAMIFAEGEPGEELFIPAGCSVNVRRRRHGGLQVTGLLGAPQEGIRELCDDFVRHVFYDEIPCHGFAPFRTACRLWPGARFFEEPLELLVVHYDRFLLPPPAPQPLKQPHPLFCRRNPQGVGRKNYKRDRLLV